MPHSITVLGVGGSLRAESSSPTALRTALEGASGAGAHTETLPVRDLDLPLYTPEAMEFSVRALRGWAVPLVMPVAQSWKVFDPEGRLTDIAIADQLRALGAEVARAAVQFRHEGTCDYADDRQFARTM